ncbi:hypothetical protein [Natronorubrum texcoconense]|uniref:Uncharacterized protein n=1 Tax=Natronorubrum texcoconense TaxID=1095776 RepID=A0A1G8VH99_9EURY|nr:hypothetical protein [Natronorubrum texcoconense]SDJ65383.1 hypothetical protein SAMN04515672_1339 [Natronorubrum texcoconense]
MGAGSSFAATVVPRFATKQPREWIPSRPKADRFETLEAVTADALEQWSKSGNDPTVLRGAELTWKTPSGGSETGFVSAVADR